MKVSEYICISTVREDAQRLSARVKFDSHVQYFAGRHESQNTPAFAVRKLNTAWSIQYAMLLENQMIPHIIRLGIRK